MWNEAWSLEINMVYASYLTSSQTNCIFAAGGAKVPTQEKKKTEDVRKLANIRKTPKHYKVIA